MNSIEVKNISKTFILDFQRTSLIKGILERYSAKREVLNKIEALRDINFCVKKGEVWGILGVNASGKTTLLKLIAGILKPTTGEIKVTGDTVAFLQLGLGFQDELSALENVYLYAAFLGMDKREVNKKLGEIREFSELGDFLNMKLKYFSAGMRARLAFSVIVQAGADIILLDEFLVVGDIYFQKKCFDTLEKFSRQGKTLILVSQSLDIMKRICQRALLLDQGRQIVEADIDTVIGRYKSLHK